MWKTLKKLINPKNFNTNFNAGIQFEINNYFIVSIGDIVDSIDGQEYTRADKYTNFYLDIFKLISLQELCKND